MHGIRTVDLPGESARYRRVSTHTADQALSLGFARRGQSPRDHLMRRQRPALLFQSLR